MKNQILQCLKLSLVPDSATVQTATLKLQEMGKMPGFCMAVMEIANENTNQIGIRQGALVQFKNMAKKYWNAKAFQISEEQKSAILGALMPAFVACANNQLLLKLYKSIVTLIVGFSSKNWIITPTINQMLNSNQDVIAVLHFVIAVHTNFEISIGDEERDQFYGFISNVLPTIFNYVQRNSNEEVVYLCMKIIWKIVHYEVSIQIKRLLCNWMDLILSVASASNQQLQSTMQEQQDKGTTQFFYFHAKKWATRIIYRFIYRHANARSSSLADQKTKQQNKQFSTMWFNQFGKRVVDTITKQFMVPTITKTRYFQIKCMTGLINNYPQEMRQYAESFQYNILLPFLQLKPEDQELANSDPLEFMNRQDDFGMNFGYLKKVAMECWLAFTNIGAKKKNKNKNEQIGVLFNENMKFLKSKLQSNNPLQKQMAMFLICELRTWIENNSQIKTFLPGLISQYVVPEFTSQIMFLRARAMQIFDEYGDMYFEKPIIKKAVEGIYFCLTQDNYPLVRLKAASAFHILLRHQQAREQVKPLFKNILQIYLILLEKYDSQKLVNSLSEIVDKFAAEVGPYACELMRYLSKHFVKLYQKDKKNANEPDYDGETQFAASGVLNTMRTLLQSPIDKESITKMQSDILDVSQFIFSANDIDYVEDIIAILRAYTHRASVMTQKLLFYYVLLIYYVTGIDMALWPSIKLLPLSQNNIKALQLVKAGSNVESLTDVMTVLRNYIALDSEILLRVNDPFGVNLMQLLFNMIDKVYQKGPSDYDGENQLNSCTVLVIYLLENNYKKWDNQYLSHMWQVAKFNLTKAKSKSLKCLNAQLLCVLLWNNVEFILQLAHQENLIAQIMVCILNSQKKIRQQHQRQRIILGICQLLPIAQQNPEILSKISSIFIMSTNLVMKNCQVRLDQDHQQNYQTESDEEQDDEDADLGKFDYLGDDNDELQDLWDQGFETNYTSKLDEIDEIKQFRDCIQKLQTEQTQFNQKLASLIPSQTLNQLVANMLKAIALTQPAA